MRSSNGVSFIPCKINGLSLELIFDTGASDVSLSLTEANFMLKNGYLRKEDILGTSNYQDATGQISEGYIINLREIDISGNVIHNVRASVVKNLTAPLLLGQSAITKLGKIQFDLSSNILYIYHDQLKLDNSDQKVSRIPTSTFRYNDWKESNLIGTVKIINQINYYAIIKGDEITIGQIADDHGLEGYLNVTFDRKGDKIYENGQRIVNTYNKKGNKIIQKAYDSLDNALNSVKQYTYDEKNTLLKWKEDDYNHDTVYTSFSLNFKWGRDGNLHEDFNSANVRTSYEYDVYGNIIAERSPGQKEGFSTYTYKYDNLGNWIERITYIDNRPFYISLRTIIYF